MGEIEKAVKNFDANPSRILWGGSGGGSSQAPASQRPSTVEATKPIATPKPVATPKPDRNAHHNAKPIAPPSNNAKPIATSSSNAKPVATSQ